MKELGEHFHGAMAMALHAFTTAPFWLALAGVAAAWWMYLKQPSVPAALSRTFSPVVRVLENKYYMDWINENLSAPAARATGRGLWKGGDLGLIDGVAINGSAAAVGGFARVVRLLQTGHLYWYALVMLLGVFGLLTWRIWPSLGPALQALFVGR
jgi:NADH-quinone oxidoreductase subunit L